MQELEYPFDSEYLLKKAKRIKKQLLGQVTADGTKIEPPQKPPLLPKKVAVLGGSTTHDIIRMLELFLLDQGMEPTFYESEYGQYFEDAMFADSELFAFAPDLIFIHTSNRNITLYPELTDDQAKVEERIQAQYEHFEMIWNKLEEACHCPVIQNNFEYPFFRLLGNAEVSNIHGRIYFINRLNLLFSQYAQNHENFYLNDMNYMSSLYGLERWADPLYWHMYKYCMSMAAIPEFAYNLSHMIKAIFGKNKKALVLDLDNTLWGGVVGDDGPENLEIGQETSMGQVYTEFQGYIKSHKDIGIMLNVASKNEAENALAGLKHPEGQLSPEDFILIKANWKPKSENVASIAKELNIGLDSLVFVDDNPAEREIVRQQLPTVAVPEITKVNGHRTTGDSDAAVGMENIPTPEQYIHILDRNGYFEVLQISEDDKNRNEMYHANLARQRQQESFGDYKDYLKSLQMQATIKAFEPMYMARIAQLTNKSNQFNLTTKRCSQKEIEEMAASEQYITRYGKLTDKFGDNGVVSVVIGRRREQTLHLELWLMSCRVLKRDMEYAMMDEIIEECIRQGVTTIKGYYYPTAKNAMVKDFYELQGFVKETEDTEGNCVWSYEITYPYIHKNEAIKIFR